jgi:hypothetical protein
VSLDRLVKAWRALAPDQRVAAVAAFALFFTMFLPWYQRTGSAVVKGRLQQYSDNLNAFQAFSFVEAAVLLVAAGILVMLFARAEGKAFHLPGGDGVVIMGAGIWVCLLVFYRQLDKPGGGAPGAIVGVQWGIFVTFLAGLGLAYAGNRVRAAHHTEPPLPGDSEPTVAAPVMRPPQRRPRPGGPPQVDGGEQLTFDE